MNNKDKTKSRTTFYFHIILLFKTKTWLFLDYTESLSIAHCTIFFKIAHSEVALVCSSAELFLASLISCTFQTKES